MKPRIFTIRRNGNSLDVAVTAWARENDLDAGDKVAVEWDDDELRVRKKDG